RLNIVEYGNPDLGKAVKREVDEQQERHIADKLHVRRHGHAQPGRPETPAECPGHADRAADQQRKRGQLQSEGEPPVEAREVLPRQKPVEMVGAHGWAAALRHRALCAPGARCLGGSRSAITAYCRRRCPVDWYRRSASGNPTGGSARVMPKYFAYSALYVGHSNPPIAPRSTVFTKV